MNVHDFSEKAMNGKEIALSDYKGKGITHREYCE